MASTTVGLVYSNATGRIRQIVIPDNDAELSSLVMGAGQSIHVMSAAAYAGQSLEQLQATLSSITGVTPTNDRYVEVDASGNVLVAHIADPMSGDGPLTPGATFFSHAVAQPGDLLIGGGKTLLPQNPPKPYLVSRPSSAGRFVIAALLRKNNDAALL